MAKKQTPKQFDPDQYEKLPYRRCGRSGLLLPAMSLGMWQSLGDKGNEQLCRRCVYWAFDHGVTHFDLANNYGNPPGNSEILFGRVLRDLPRDELIISTKAGFDMWPGPYGTGGSRKYLVASLDQSLKRLGLDYVDIFYHHRPDPETPLAETMGALDHIVRSGKAIYAGVSNYKAPQFLDAIELVEHNALTSITIHQAKYNMMNRAYETDLFAHAAAGGTGVIVYSVLDKGMLSERYLEGVPKDSRLAKRGAAGREYYESLRSTGKLEQIRELAELARSRGQSLSQMAITWALRDERITSVLVGISSLDQLKENLAALDSAPLSGDELQRIDSVLGQ